LETGAEKFVRSDITITSLALHIIDLPATMEQQKSIVESSNLVGAVPIGAFDAGDFEVAGAGGSGGAG
jgi:hypothetical protein